MRARILLPVLLACIAGPIPTRSAAAQQDLLSTLSRTETILWQAWKDRDPLPFQKYLVDDAFDVDATGVTMGKQAYLASLHAQKCDIQSFAFSDLALHRISPDVAVLTYRATQAGVCDGHKLPGAVIASSIYVRKGGTWMNAGYHESTAETSSM